MKECSNMRVEQHIIKESNPFYHQLKDFCHASKNLYNHANYLIRQSFIENNKYIKYETIDKILKKDKEHPDYAEMPTAQSAQQTLRVLDRNWKAFFSVMDKWKKSPETLAGRPKIPGYIKKDGLFVVIIPGQSCRISDDTIRFPKIFNGFETKFKAMASQNFVSFRQARFVPSKRKIVLELIYTVKETKNKPDNGRYIGIDIGVNNLATCVNNIGAPAFVINGKPLKAINRYWNKELAQYRSILEHTYKRKTSKRIDKLSAKRYMKIKDYMHKASRYIISFCEQNNINTIIIGKNDDWKTDVDLGKRNNQNFVQIPSDMFLQMISYKAKNIGITVIMTEESYTSGTSFIDDENPIKKNYNNQRRIERGMFISEKGIPINADVNAGYQIIRKVFPIKWDSGCALHPVVVNMS